MKKYFLYLTSLTIFISCNIANKLGDKLKLKSLNDEYNFNIKSNSDNLHIYSTHKEFIFNVIQNINLDTINFKISLKVLPQKRGKNALIKYEYRYLEEDLLKYKIAKKCKSEQNELCFIELTSINEFDTWHFMHPPRLHTLDILEIAPFPMLIPEYNKWSQVLEIPKGSWGIWENTDFQLKYKIENIEMDSDSIPINYHISSESTSNFGLNTNSFQFNIDSGFTSMNYQFQDYGNVEIKLEKIIKRE